eukprot:jgi/Psemu1/43057/gm1.43057_g
MLPSASLRHGKKELDWQNSELYTYVAFGVFRKQRAARLRDNAVLNTLPPPPGTEHSQAKTPNQLKYESWCRKSHDETSFTALQNDSRFEHWLIRFKAKLEAHDIDTDTFLDSSWPQSNLIVGFKRNLFVKQCAFFWVLMLLVVFKSDLSSSCVLSHSSKCDGRQAYLDFINLHSRSKSKVYGRHLNPVEDSPKSIPLRPPTRPLEYKIVKTALCQGCVTDPLDSNDVSVFIQAEADAIHDLKITLLFEATHLDSQALLSISRFRVRAHAHNLSSKDSIPSMDDSNDYFLPIDFDGDFQDYAVFKTGRTPGPTTRLPAVIWKTLSRSAMKGWLNIPADNKKKLIASTGPQHHQLKPMSRRAYTHDQSVTLYDNAAANDTSASKSPSEDLHPAVEVDWRGALQASLGIYKSQVSLPQAHQPLKSSVPTAHAARFLAEIP